MAGDRRVRWRWNATLQNDDGGPAAPRQAEPRPVSGFLADYLWPRADCWPAVRRTPSSRSAPRRSSTSAPPPARSRFPIPTTGRSTPPSSTSPPTSPRSSPRPISGERSVSGPRMWRRSSGFWSADSRRLLVPMEHDGRCWKRIARMFLRLLGRRLVSGESWG